jgi:sigma-B regulation protein RsbU (phosphoserine phosphatase)
VVRLAAQGAPIGMLPDTAYPVESIPLHPGDLLVVFSDGLTEARDPNDNEFGETRLGQTIDPGRDLPVSELRERIFATIDRFRGNRPPEDDMTLVVARVR